MSDMPQDHTTISMFTVGYSCKYVIMYADYKPSDFNPKTAGRWVAASESTMQECSEFHKWLHKHRGEYDRDKRYQELKEKYGAE